MSKEINDRLKLIKRAIDKNDNHTQDLHIVPKTEMVNEFLNSESNNQVIDAFISETKAKYSIDLNPEVNMKEIKELVEAIGTKYDSQKLKILVDDCKASVLDSIIKPFGIAGILFEDKLGGNVDTIHNVRNTDKKYNNGQGIYATEENKKKNDKNPVYDPNLYHKHENYIENNKKASEAKENGDLKDPYRNKNVKRNDDTDLDHTISANEIHNDPGRILAGLDGADLACDDSNLNPTDRSVNRSKKDKSVDEFIKYLEENRKSRQSRIDELKSKTNLSHKEEKELNKLQKLEEVDVNNIKQKDEEARREYNKKVNKAYYTSPDFIKNVGKTSAKEGLKMGFQQAIGVMVREFALAVFSEVEEIFAKRHNIKINNEFVNSLKERFERIAQRVVSKWKDVAAAFGSGVVSGFFSNITTVIVNTFLTTSKRVVKMIREGFYSLLKAVKMLFFPPENISKEEAAREATKLIASGLIVVGGIALEEMLQEALVSVPVIGMFSSELSTVIMGIVTGLSMALLVYLIDKVDLFKVNANKKQEYIINQLDEMIDNELKELESSHEYIATSLGI